MAITIEAGSLSSITHIAANPPQQLIDYQHQHIQPLVLYIARVPGRRDVFLTPLKPRDRVVTAEDVQSSLYYVHVNNEDDSDLVSKHIPETGPDLHSGSSSQSIRDPQQNPYTLSHASGGDKSYPGSNIIRKPLLSDITNSQPRQLSPAQKPPPLPPRPLPKLPDEAASQDEHATTSPVNLLSPTLPMTPAEMSAQEARTGALTVIRRDPATADQWNVAIVHDQILHDRSSWRNSLTAASHAKRSNRSLDIEITNPAYWSFPSEHSAMRYSEDSSIGNDVPSEPLTPFTRHPSTQQTGTDGPLASSIDPYRSSMSSEDRSHRRSVFSTSESIVTSRIKRRSGNFSFVSPWHGDCTFTTTSAGQALRCVHQLPHTHKTHNVSELRFNLPHTSQQQASKDESRSKRASRIGNLHQRFRSRDSDSHISAAGEPSDYRGSDDGDFSSMDLSLGQEQAGGGFGGRQAKLGKLIIYPDGLPMLDLLVAANMGLWWRAWDRTT